MKFLISQAFASAPEAAPAVTASAAPAAMAAADMPGAGEAFMLNMLLILILVALFYVLLIVPQQKRFKKHREMIDGLKKGDRVLTSGGLIGTVDKLVEGKDEAIIDLGSGLKVTALRSTLQGRVDDDNKLKAA